MGELAGKIPLFEQQLLTESEVDERIELMALDLRARYKDERPLFVCLLKGGAPFAMKLMSAITRQDPEFHPELDYMIVKTYGKEREASEPRIITDLSPETIVRGRRAAILDDVSDTNKTLAATERHLIDFHGATVVDVIMFADKPEGKEVERTPDIVGVRAPRRWLTGMGLDDVRIAPEANRWAGYLAISQDPEE
ncbi:hypothetical protein KW794_00245 [Candidatus Saccharibacteria bacterium]|nr:hypothetical protein [Candidatus Saccharibacteria bacterium]